MTAEPPKGYEEIGESMARLVVEGLRSRRWVGQVVAALGYHEKHVRAWVRYYEKINAHEIEKAKRKAERKRARIQEKLAKSNEILDSQDMTA